VEETDVAVVEISASDVVVAEISASDAAVAETLVTDKVVEILVTASAVLPASPLPTMGRSEISATGSERGRSPPLPRWSVQSLAIRVLPGLLRPAGPTRIVKREKLRPLLGVQVRVRAPALRVASLSSAPNARSVFPPLPRRTTSGARGCAPTLLSNRPHSPAMEAKPRPLLLEDRLPSLWDVPS